jgi:hypothetical protein
MNRVEERHHPQGVLTEEKLTDFIRVFDLEKQEWRGFNASSVTEFEIKKSF